MIRGPPHAHQSISLTLMQRPLPQTETVRPRQLPMRISPPAAAYIPPLCWNWQADVPGGQYQDARPPTRWPVERTRTTLEWCGADFLAVDLWAADLCAVGFRAGAWVILTIVFTVAPGWSTTGRDVGESGAPPRRSRNRSAAGRAGDGSGTATPLVTSAGSTAVNAAAGTGSLGVGAVATAAVAPRNVMTTARRAARRLINALLRLPAEPRTRTLVARPGNAGRPGRAVNPGSR